MQICHVYRQFYPVTVGGIETQISLITNFLSKYDRNLHFSLITDRAAFLPFLHRNLAKIEYYDNLRVFRLGPNVAGLADGFLEMIQMKAGLPNQKRLYVRKLRKIVSQRLFDEARKIKEVGEVDVFHVHGLYGMDIEYELLPFLLSRFFEKPLIVHIRGTYSPGPEVMPLPDDLRMEILNYADLILTHNTNVLNKLKEWSLECKSYLIPNAVDLEKFRMGKESCGGSKNGSNIALIGRLQAFKDPITAIFAFRLLLKNVPDAKLHIVGNGMLENAVRRLVQRLGLDKSVIMYGPRRDVDSFLQKSDVFWAVSPVDNYPSNSVLEAMASGLPVVATDVGLTKELIVDGQNGLLVPPRNPKELAKATEEILTNQVLRESLSINARSTAEKYDVKVIYPRIAQLYYSVSRKR